MLKLAQPAASSAFLFILAAAMHSAVAETTAVAVLGQQGFATQTPNAPSGTTNAQGIFLSNAPDLAIAPSGRLYVSDPENHRVLSWPNATTFASFAAADMVFGQPDFVSSTLNNGGVSATSLALPQGVWVDAAGGLWVTDAFNHRVLRFRDPETDATPAVADQVIGQPDFASSGEQFGAGKESPNERGLLFPGRVVVRGVGLPAGDIWIADSGNSRVLRFPLVESNAPTATHVFGQFGRFDTRVPNNDGTGQSGCCASAANLFNPIGIAVDAVGVLYVADWQNHRVLIYQNPPGSDALADAVVGQPNLTSNSPDNPTVAAGLHLPIDLAFDGRSNLYVADGGNHRVLRIHTLNATLRPQSVYGQLGQLNRDAPNHGLGPFATDADGLFGPTGVGVADAGRVLVVDTENQRVLRFPLAALPALGDLNCDGVVSVGDIAGFVLALTNAAAYEAAFPDCLRGGADVNGNGVISVGDIGAFVGLLTR